MRNWKFHLVAVLLVSTIYQVNAQDRKNFPITKEKITKDIILYKAGLTDAYSNMVAVNTSKGVVVFDALQYPDVAQKVRKMIRMRFGDRFACLVNTHAALDHTGGNEVFEDIPIIGHTNVKMEMYRDLENWKSPQFQQWMNQILIKSEQFWQNYPRNPTEITENAESNRNMIDAVTKNQVKTIVPDTLFADQYVLNMGNKTFRMYHNTPSYSESDIIIYIPEDKVVIVGDIFNKNRLPWLSRSFDLESWGKLFAPYISDNSDVKYFIGTHGQVMTIDEVREQFNYLRKLYAEVKRIKTEGKTVDVAMKELSLDHFPYLSNFNPFFYGTVINMHNNSIQVIWKQLTESGKP